MKSIGDAKVKASALSSKKSVSASCKDTNSGTIYIRVYGHHHIVKHALYGTQDDGKGYASGVRPNEVIQRTTTTANDSPPPTPLNSQQVNGGTRFTTPSLYATTTILFPHIRLPFPIVSIIHASPETTIYEYVHAISKPRLGSTWSLQTPTGLAKPI